MDGMLTSEQAAARLGIKVTTLYVYVSRGLLESHRAPDGRRSLFALADVEALAKRSRGGRSVGSRMAVVSTSITEIRTDGPFYRGIPAVELASGSTPEQVAELLWRTEPGEWLGADVSPPNDLSARDRLPWTVVMAGATDPLRSDLRPEAVARAARRVITTLATDPVTPVPRRRLPDPTGSGLAELLATTCAGGAPSDALITAVRVAMILLADHELATSTLAVRVAASTRADLHDALLAGLGTLAGPLHGSASTRVVALLDAARRDGAARAIDEFLRWQRLVPGFGHGAYPDGDPRCTALLTAVLDGTTAEDRSVVDDVLEVAAAARLPPPNVDLALGALPLCHGVDPRTLPLLFAVARCSGWVAHYLEELDEAPLRFRARAVHVASPARPE